MGPRLLTDRLELRPLEAAAAGALPDQRQAAAEIIGAELSPDWPQPAILDILPTQAASTPEQNAFRVWLIIERRTKTVIGDIGFFGPPGPDRSVEIGYVIVPDSRRQGYAPEAARALLDWVLDQPGVDVVTARTDESNATSIRILRKLGFAPAGRADGWLRWRLSPEPG